MNTSFHLSNLTTALIKCAITIFTLTLGCSMMIVPDARANYTPPRLTTIKFNPPPPPPNRGAPGNRGQGGSRGCGLGNQSLKALMPVYQETFSQHQKELIPTTQVWGLTSVENPTFWFYVPYTSSSIKATEFVLQNEQKKTIYRTPLTIPNMPGIVSFRLSSTSAALEFGKNYHWFFKLHVIACDPQQPFDLDYVEGWVQRTHLNGQLGDRLKQATPEQRVALYAENGLWYDALSALAELRLANSKNTDLTVGWTSLLRSVGLENLANKPLVKCCDPNF